MSTLRAGRLARRGWPAALALIAVASTGAASPAMAASAPAMLLPAPHSAATAATGDVASLGRLLRAEVLVVRHKSLPADAVSAVRKLPGVVAARTMDAARIQVNGKFVAMLGVDPPAFRNFTARPTARSNRLWKDIAAGGIDVSYTMGKQTKLPLGGTVKVAGRISETLRVSGFATVGIGGVDAIVSERVAQSLGFPAGNAMVVSAPTDRVASLVRKIKARVPRDAMVEPLVSTSASGRAAPPGVAGATVTSASPAAGTVTSPAAGTVTITRGLVTAAQLTAMLRAAVSRVGMPYVWGAAGPTAFDCSGLVQWSFARAGIVMPRVAADQARTGPAVPTSKLQAGDLLFYRYDPTAPDYISHVAIYLGKGLMIQAPQPGEKVQIVPLVLGSAFAGAVRVAPAIAAQVAASPVG
ncbi:MAG TPA: C40 family peptidase [Streptosporangiaceae bacterium]|nr:C40 family peptidase [Streptosporangiaceae bacterium]